ncbi:MAG: phage major capsid protein [Alphaproteobacteria bacterium]
MNKKFLNLPLEIKACSNTGLITGYASVFNIIDFHNDILIQGAFYKTISTKALHEIKLLWQHKVDEPIGIISHIEEDKYGLYIEAKLLLNVNRALEAYYLIKEGSIRGLSIGYKPKEYYYNEEHIRVITEVELKEISLVTFPANNEASIINYKTINFLDLSNKLEKVHELYAQPKATQKLIDDSSIDVEKWLGEKLLNSFAAMENRAFIHGDGIGKPRGILSYNAGSEWGEIEQINTGIIGDIKAESLFDLHFSLKEQYASRAVFLMHKTIVQKIRMLKDKNNQYLWHPGLDKASPATLLGLPVKHCADMPLANDENACIAVADFKSAYKIVDRKGIKILRDPFTEKPFVKFYATKRVGGDVINYEAIKLLKFTQ